MYKNKTSLSGNTFFSLLGFIVPLLLAFLTIPILIDRLGTAKFGLLTISWMILGYFSLFDLGLGRTLVKIVGEKLAKNKIDDIPVLFWTSLLLMCGIGFLAVLLFLPISGQIVSTLNQIPPGLHGEATRTIKILILGIPFVVFTAGLQGVMEGQQNFRLVGILRILNGTLTFGGSLAAVLITTRIDLIALVLLVSRMVYGLVCFILDLWVFPPLRRVSIDLHHAGSLLTFGGWLTVSNLISPFLVYFDRFFVGAWISLQAVAYYVTPYEIVTKSSVLTTALVSVLFPTFAGKFAVDKGKAEAIYLKARKTLSLLLFPVALLFIILGNSLLKLWLGEEFALHGTIVMQLLAIGIFVNGPAQIAFVLIQAANRPDFTAKWHLIEVPFYLLLLYAGTKYYGLAGAALAWTVRVTVDAVLLFWFAGKLLQISSGKGKSFAIFMGIAILLLFLLTLPKLSDGMSLLAFASGMIIYALIVWRLLLDRGARERTKVRLSSFRDRINLLGR